MNQGGETALMIGIYDKDTVNVLLDMGADVNMMSQVGTESFPFNLISSFFISLNM